VLRSAPVIDGKVIFSSYGCWDVAGLHATAYYGTTQVLGPQPAAGSQVKPAALPGEPLFAVPLAAVEKIASGH
jgi:hypothetical protein